MEDDVKPPKANPGPRRTLWSRNGPVPVNPAILTIGDDLPTDAETNAFKAGREAGLQALGDAVPLSLPWTEAKAYKAGYRCGEAMFDYYLETQNRKEESIIPLRENSDRIFDSPMKLAVSGKVFGVRFYKPSDAITMLRLDMESEDGEVFEIEDTIKGARCSCGGYWRCEHLVALWLSGLL